MKLAAWRNGRIVDVNAIPPMEYAIRIVLFQAQILCYDILILNSSRILSQVSRGPILGSISTVSFKPILWFQFIVALIRLYLVFYQNQAYQPCFNTICSDFSRL